MDKFNIDKNVISLLKLINSYGYKAYIVGGALRDILLELTPTDYDICTNMPINELEKEFKEFIIERKGKTFLSLKIKYKNTVYEITNTRKEGEYSKPGYPSFVTLTDSIYEDLKRRDFTINALAYSIEDGLIDDNSSLDDIKNKILRTINNPYLRFKEDPSRILRGIRFASKFNLTIEENTLNAMEMISPQLKNLSYNKIMKEFYKILSLDNINLAIDILDKINFFEIMWGLKSNLNSKNYYQNLNNLKLSTNNVDSRLSILFRLSSIKI